MRILVVSATSFEVEDLKSEVGSRKPEVEFLLTGVGMVAASFALGQHLATNQYDLAINLGIAGSFDRTIALGEIVEIVEDRLSELGAEDDEAFLPIEALGFGEGVFKTDTRLSSYNDQQLKQVTAITVNTVHGHEPSIQKLTARIRPQLESMEGAAFFYACKQVGVPCLQIRAVSNYVEKRSRDAWQIGLAIKNLNSFAIEFIREVLRST
jgi:futalosine hydrolase